MAATAIQQGLYSCEVSAIANKKLEGWSAATLAAWWGEGRSLRAKELVWTLFGKGHKEDPVQAITFRRLTMLRKRLLLHPKEHREYEKQ